MMESFFLHCLDHYQAIAYAVLFLGMILEGDLILFSAFFLAQQGHLNLYIVIAVSITGVISGDILWYLLGEKISREGFIGRHFERAFSHLDQHLRKNTLRTIFISKFTYGLNHLTLMRAGTMRIAFPRYLKFNIYSALAWVGIIGLLGYAFSVSLSSFERYFKFAEIALLVALLFFIIISGIITSGGKKELLK